MEKCNDTLGSFKGCFFIKNYSHIMSDKIRKYLYLKEFEKLGFNKEQLDLISNQVK